jgi:hypothetical protein
MKHAVLAGVVVLSCAAVAWGKHVAPDTNVVIVPGGSACPAGTTQLHTGSSVIFKNPGNGNLTEDARCWQSTPSTTSEVTVVVLGPCVVCRFGP